MPREIFDQERPRSAMARRLDEAFAGCDQWTLAPPSQRRSEVVSRLSSSARVSGSAAAVHTQEPRAL
ncbi:MAG TPA: hypothetical protein VN752_01645 [Solirubrobacterales bacterium]|nr:hypothetical protein [Solirubrobacterales bacterium]